MDTMDVVRRIKLALRTRSGKVWSVTRGRGTTSCWLFIDTPRYAFWVHVLRFGA
jgi:hypothetical protein